MIYNFKDWLNKRQESRIDEAIPQNAQYNQFLYFDQKQGDFVYFGVHDIQKFYKENNYYPRQLDIETILNKMGTIVNANHVKRTIKVITNKDPYHYGYRKLETAEKRQKRREKLGANAANTIEVEIPVSYLEDITKKLGTGAVLSGNKLWLVIDGNTKLQNKIAEGMRKEEQDNDQQKLLPPPDADQADRIRQQWQSELQQQKASQPTTAASLFGEPENKPSHRMVNREVIPADADKWDKINKLRQRKQNPLGDYGLGQTDLAHADYSILSKNRYWKQHADNRLYEYYQP